MSSSEMFYDPAPSRRPHVAGFFSPDEEPDGARLASEVSRLLALIEDASAQRTDATHHWAPAVTSADVAKAAVRALREKAGDDVTPDADARLLALLGLLLNAPGAPVRAVAASALLEARSNAARALLRNRAALERSKMVSALLRAALEAKSRD